MRRCVFLLLTILAFANAANEVEITAEPHHHFTFANEQVRVFNVEVAPHSETLMHWHRHDYVFVTLGAADVVNAIKDKAPITLKLADGETRFSAASFAHVARNLSDQPFRNVTIELLQDGKLRQSPTKWDDDRGLEVLNGGTQEILWVNDGVRASEFELQPGGRTPMHHHAGPYLLVAVTDLALHKAVAGQSPGPVQLKSGEVYWVPGGDSHTLTNTGQQSAKFVTLEFQ
jgi:beta-alanine degradation protein BauB